MRRMPSIVALLFALVACGSLGALLALELQRATPDTTTRGAIAGAAKERAQARADRFAASDRTFDTAFDPAMVRDKVTWSAAGYPKTTDVTIVNATPGADLAESARACAEEIGAQVKTRVQCYAYANTEVYEFKNITGDLDLDTPTAISNLCWAVLANNERAGGPLRIADMRLAPQTWNAQGCPSSWLGTSKQKAGAA